MYGLLLENLSEYVKTVFGDEKWDEIRRAAGISSPSFGVHDDYDENLLNNLAKTAQQVSPFNKFLISTCKLNTTGSKKSSFFYSGKMKRRNFSKAAFYLRISLLFLILKIETIQKLLKREESE